MPPACGSISLISSFETFRRSGTWLFLARSYKPSMRPSSSSRTAMTSLPVSWYGSLCSWQYSRSRDTPRTVRSALRLPGV